MATAAGAGAHSNRTQTDTFRGLLQLIAVGELASGHWDTHECTMGHKRGRLWRRPMQRARGDKTNGECGSSIMVRRVILPGSLCVLMMRICTLGPS